MIFIITNIFYPFFQSTIKKETPWLNGLSTTGNNWSHRITGSIGGTKQYENLNNAMKQYENLNNAINEKAALDNFDGKHINRVFGEYYCLSYQM